MIYLDTSLLVRLYLEDPGFEVVRTLASRDHIACAIHGQAETVGAFHRKLREKAISPKSYQAVINQFDADERKGAFQWLPITQDIVARVRGVYAKLPSEVYLRSADALHLAAAAVNELGTVYSNDAHLLAAAPSFGLAGVNPLATGR